MKWRRVERDSRSFSLLCFAGPSMRLALDNSASAGARSAGETYLVGVRRRLVRDQVCRDIDPPPSSSLCEANESVSEAIGSRVAALCLHVRRRVVVDVRRENQIDAAAADLLARVVLAETFERFAAWKEKTPTADGKLIKTFTQTEINMQIMSGSVLKCQHRLCLSRCSIVRRGNRMRDSVALSGWFNGISNPPSALSTGRLTETDRAETNGASTVGLRNPIERTLARRT